MRVVLVLVQVLVLVLGVAGVGVGVDDVVLFCAADYLIFAIQGRIHPTHIRLSLSGIVAC